jgi:heptosyltransferase-3
MIAHRARNLGLAIAARIPATPVPTTSGELLLIRPDHLGDLLFLTPALHRLRLALPGAKITLATGPWSVDVLKSNPDLDEIISIPFPGFSRQPQGNPLGPYRILSVWEKQLRSRRPAAAVILRDDHWWAAWLVHRAGIPIRIGSDQPIVRRFLTQPTPLSGPHWVRRNAALLDATISLLGGRPAGEPVMPCSAPLQWSVTDDDETRASALLRDAGVSEPFVVIHPGAGAPVKYWPAERWASVAAAIQADSGYTVVLTGSAAEQPLVESIQRGLRDPAVSLANRTDLRQLAVVYRHACLVCGVDSGPLHLAVAVGTPTIHLYGPSLIEDYGPWGDPLRHRVISAGMRCSRCGDLSPSRPEGAGCMLRITSDVVSTTARELLADG